MNKLLETIINVFAIYRLTNLFYQEEGPFLIFERIREYFGLYIIETDEMEERIVDESNGYNFFARLLSCFWCTSLYTSLLVIILNMFNFGKLINQILSYSGLAILIFERNK